MPSSLRGRSKRTQRLRAATALALAIGLLYVLLAVFSDPLEAVQTTFTDNLFREEAGSPNIAVVGVNDETFDHYDERLGEWPRTRHAAVINELRAAGASVIVYDVLFAEESEDQQEDVALASSVAKAGNVVLAAAGSDLNEARSDDLEQLAKEVTRAVNASVGIPPKEVVLVEPGTVPKTSSGKLQRSACKVQYASGELARLG